LYVIRFNLPVHLPLFPQEKIFNPPSSTPSLFSSPKHLLSFLNFDHSSEELSFLLNPNSLLERNVWWLEPFLRNPFLFLLLPPSSEFPLTKRKYLFFFSFSSPFCLRLPSPFFFFFFFFANNVPPPPPPVCGVPELILSFFRSIFPGKPLRKHSKKCPPIYSSACSLTLLEVFITGLP